MSADKPPYVVRVTGPAVERAELEAERDALRAENAALRDLIRTIDMTHTLLGPTGGTLFLGAAADSWLTDEQEIGRASCRERV